MLSRLVFGLSIALSVALCSVTAFADKPPSLLPPDLLASVVVDDIETVSSTEVPPVSDNEPSTEVPPIADNEPSTEVPPIADNEPSTEAPPIVDNEPTTEAPPIADNEPTTEAPPIVDNEPSTEAPPYTEILQSAEITEIVYCLKSINGYISVFVNYIIPCFSAVVLLYFGIRWFSRTFFPM